MSSEGCESRHCSVNTEKSISLTSCKAVGLLYPVITTIHYSMYDYTDRTFLLS